LNPNKFCLILDYIFVALISACLTVILTFRILPNDYHKDTVRISKRSVFV